MVFISDILLYLATVIVATLIVVIVFFKKRYTHWKNLGVEYAEPTIPFGNLKDLFAKKTSISDWTVEFYTNMKSKNLKHGGFYMFHNPVYVPIDLDLVKHIMQNDFIHFTDHISYVNEKDDPMSASVFALGGERWRNLRIKLTPTFTTGKMKLMFPIIVKISEEFVGTLQKECGVNSIEAKDLCGRFTMDVIGNCAFGIDCNSLKDPNTEFRVQGKRLFSLTNLEMIKTFLNLTFPSIMKFFGAGLMPAEPTKFFWDVIKDTAEYRNKNGVRRNDAFQLLLDMLHKEGEKGDDTITFGELAAQAFIFFTAGFETTSALMSFALLELALNEDVQNRLRDEVHEVLKKNSEELTYEALFDMRYLEMVINETLRKHPPLPNLTRECTKDYQVPDSNVIIRKGGTVIIPLRGIHYHSEYYPNPEKFNPERFTEENKRKRHQFAFIPFGEGPRICLGLRFGVMQAKVGLVSLVKKFKFKVNPKTELPPKLDPKNFVTSVLGGLWMDVERIC